MEINIGENYKLTSDRYNVALEKKHVAKKGKHAGEVTWTTEGYYPDILKACEAYLRLKINISDANKINELIQTVQDAVEDIRQYVSVRS